MRLKFSLILFLIIFCFFIIDFAVIYVFKNNNKNFLVYELEGRKLKLLIADEPQEWERGLMFVREPINFDGMIFLFPDKQIRYFWNKNTFLDLEIYWLDDDKIVGKDFLPSIEKTKEIYTIQSPAAVNKVIEVIIKK